MSEQPHPQPGRQARALRLALQLLALLYIIILLSFVIKGAYSRYMQDDYCYGKEYDQKGFFRMQADSYLVKHEYGGNRYSLTFFYTLAEIPQSSQFEGVLPGLSLVLWVAALAWLVLQLGDLLGRPLRFEWALLLSLGVVCFIHYLAPDPYQSLYWRSGRFTYQSALWVNTFLAARVLQLRRKQGISLWHALEVSLLALLSTGFAETSAAWQFVLWVFLLLYSLNRDRKEDRRSPLTGLSGIVLAATFAGMVLLALSPTNRQALQAPWVHVPPFGVFLFRSFKAGFSFLKFSLESKWLPLGVVLAAGALLRWAAPSAAPVPVRGTVLRLAAAVAGIYLVTVATGSPVILIRNQFPDPRAWFPAHYTLIAGLVVLGMLLYDLWAGIPLPGRLRSWRAALPALLLAGIVLYSLRLVGVLYSDVSPYRSRGLAWDARERYILEQKAAGVLDVTVPAFDSIGGVAELQDDPGDWVNYCAARYYGVRTITAVEDYLGIEPYFK